MKDLKREIRNEIIKIYSNKLLILVLSCMMLFCLINIFNQFSTQYSENWRQDLQEEIELNKEIMSQLNGQVDKDTYKNQILQNKKLQYYLDNNISPNTTVLQFVHDALDLNFLLIFLSVLIFSYVFCIEKNCGTEQIYLTRSIKREILILAKLISASIVVTFLYLIAILITILFGVIFFSKNGIGFNTVIIDLSGNIMLGNYIPILINALMINGLLILFLIAMTSLVAVIIRKQLFVVLIPFLVWNFGGSLADTTSFIPEKFQFLFFVYPLNYFSSVSSGEILWSSSVVVTMTISILVYTLLMLILTVGIFIKRSTCGRKLTYKTYDFRRKYK